MLCRTKLLGLQLNCVRIYQSSAKSRVVRKAPDCKFESDDKECLPRRCVPPITVCHTLPKQKCVKIKEPPKPAAEVPTTRSPCDPSPPAQPPCVKPPDPCARKTADVIWYKRMLPNEENMSPAGKMAYGFLKFNAKALIAGGSLYLTAKCGVWGNNEQTADLYKKSHDSVTSLIKSNAGKVADVPDSREIAAACKHYWNKGVILTISSLVILPRTLTKWSKELYKQVSDNISPEVSSKS